jgi:iron(III) transport system ATP-binding protein
MSRVLVSGVDKRYGRDPVLTGVDLSVPDGSITAVLGPSGCGKTTLLRLVAGFIEADAGTVAIGDALVAGPGTHVPAQRRGVGYVAQEGALFPHLQVRDNVLFGVARKERTDRLLHEMLDLAELPHALAGAYPAELSGGQQQRVAIVRALAPGPGVVLLDEPFSGLDAALRASAGRGVLRLLRQAGATAILVTHDQDEALSLADQVAVMRDGRVAQAATPVQLYREPVDTGVAAFVGGANLLPGRAVVTGGGPSARHVDTALGVLPLAAGVPPGEVQVVVRPEQVRLGTTSDATAGSALPASVEDVIYYGHDATIWLRLDDDTTLVSRVVGDQVPRNGDRLLVQVAGQVRAFPAAAHGPTTVPAEHAR